MRLNVVTDNSLEYYHSKLLDTFVTQTDFNNEISSAIDDYLENVNWTSVIGNTYATAQDVEDLISSADLDNYMPLSGGTFTGAVNGVTPTAGDSSTKLATTAYVQGELSNYTPTSSLSSSYLPLSGGNLSGNLGTSGNLTFSGTSNHIDYNGSQANYSMIRFLDNSGDTYGNGISIGGGGVAIIGGGESAQAMEATLANGGSEVLYLCNDGNVDIYTNCQSGSSSAKHFVFTTDGKLQFPNGATVWIS